VAGADEGQAARRGQLQVWHRQGGGKKQPRNQKKKKSVGAGGGKDDRNPCHNCGKKGHWTKDCRAPWKEQANLTRKDDEESVLMAWICEINADPAPRLLEGGLHLHEPTTHVFLDADSDNELQEGWYLDMGVFSHMTGRADSFSLFDRAVQGTVRFGNGSVVPIEGRGIVTFLSKTGGKIKIADVLYIPRLKNNIISLGQLDERGWGFKQEYSESGITDIVSLSRFTGLRIGCMYCRSMLPAVGVRHDEREDERWHDRFSHIGYDALRQLSRRDMVTRLSTIEEKQSCDTCIITKQHRAPFPAKVKYLADAPLDLVHGDLCGPIKPAMSARWRFFLLLVDDATRYMWLTLLSTKGDAASVIKVIKATTGLEVGRSLRVLKTDNGGEFTVKEFATYCSYKRVHRHFSAPYTPQWNGVVERRNQTVLGMVHELLKECGMPARFWGETVTTAIFLLNCTSTKALSGKTPFEAYHGCKSVVGFLKTFGCVGFVKNKRLGLKKLDDRSTPMVFIGYFEGAKAYRMLELGTGCVHVSRDVIFDENRGWEWDSAASDDDSAA
jgi:hypothetical protein